MPEDGNADPVEVKLDGAHLTVDARPARLVSQLRGASGDPVFTAHAVGSDPHTEAVPSGARQCTFQLIDELSVEATRAADFVALIAEEGGRRVIVAFTGEVTVVPGGSDDRFALAAHEALLIPGGGGEPRVVPADSLSEADQDEISSVVEEASLAVVSPSTATANGPTDDAPTEKVSAVPAEEKAAATGAAAPAGGPAGGGAAGGGAAQPSRGPGGQPAKAGGQKRQGGKKGKKGRPQPGPAKKAAPLVPGGAGAAGAMGGGGAAAGAAKKTGSPTKKAGSAPAKKAASGRPTSAGAARTGGRSDDGDDRPQNRGLLAWAGGIGVLIALVVVVFVLTNDTKPSSNVSADAGASTTEAPTASTVTTAAPTTTGAPVSTTAPVVASTASPPTTTAPATTAAPAAPAVAYSIEPKTCQQKGNSITYTATILNKSTAAFDYTITVVFKDKSGAAVANASANVAKLAPNKAIDFTATGTANKDLANSGASCDVQKVDAKPSGA